LSPLFNWAAKKADRGEAPDRPAPLITETLATSRALPKFISALSHQTSPVLLDLGAVVGSNVSFFGDRLSCKMLIEDLHEDIEAAVRDRTTSELAGRLATRLTTAVTQPVHGILCWDVFDYLDKPAARALAGCLRGLLQPKGLLHGLFGTVSARREQRTRFIVQSENTMKCRTEPWVPIQSQAFQTGEITRMFEGLTVVESVLLQSKTRETLFRK